MNNLTTFGKVVVCMATVVFCFSLSAAIYLKGRLDGLSYARTVVCDHPMAHVEHPALCEGR